MAQARWTLAPVPDAAASAASARDMPWLDPWLQLQKLQWELVGAWQQALLAVQNELFDEWACRWAGGVPLDA